ncbi:MAG: hypothetical protein ABSF89_08830 [Acidimicrobiales bacterium]|jgi:hypothetical protein
MNATSEKGENYFPVLQRPQERGLTPTITAASPLMNQVAARDSRRRLPRATPALTAVFTVKDLKTVVFADFYGSQTLMSFGAGALAWTSPFVSAYL